MKKILVLPLLLFGSSFVFAQQQRQPVMAIDSAYMPANKFSIPIPVADVCVARLTSMLGAPTSNTTGVTTWKAVRIEGLQEPVGIRIRDGITTSNKEAGSECWSPFASAADKQTKLAALAGNQWRDMTIEITDQQDGNIITSREKEKAVKNFLDKVFQQK